MAESEAQICSFALDMLKADPIDSLDEDSTNAKLCSRSWPLIRDAVLRAYPWNCALRFASLAADGTAPPFKWARSFTLPNGPEDPLAGVGPYALRVWKINGEVEYDKKYALRGRKIYTDEAAPLEIEYLGRLLDVSQYDALLVQALAARLAWLLAYPLTGSTQVMRDMRDSYKAVLDEARQVDAQEGSPEDLLADDFIESRL